MDLVGHFGVESNCVCDCFVKVLGLNFQIWNKNRWWLTAGVTMVSMTTGLGFSHPILHRTYSSFSQKVLIKYLLNDESQNGVCTLQLRLTFSS